MLLLARVVPVVDDGPMLRRHREAAGELRVSPLRDGFDDVRSLRKVEDELDPVC